jgi:signal peptidase II
MPGRPGQNLKKTGAKHDMSNGPEPSATAKRLIIIIVAGLTAVLDQASKYVILQQVGLYQTIAVIPGFFSITHIHNPGGAFGFMAGQSHLIRSLLFILVSLVATGFILYLYARTPRRYPFLLTALAMIFGGALGNLTDRVRKGVVVDFLDFHISGLHWPAFNLADSAISIGMAVLLYYIMFKKVPV